MGRTIFCICIADFEIETLSEVELLSGDDSDFEICDFEKIAFEGESFEIPRAFETKMDGGSHDWNNE